MAEHESSRICQLATIISTNTDRYNAYLVKNGHPSPSFGTETPPSIDVPHDIAEARNAVIEANEELQALMLGPIGHVQRQTLDHTNLIGLHAICKFGIAESFPVNTPASYEKIAKACDLSESVVRRFIRYGATKRIFRESDSASVEHTAASKVLASSPALRDWVGMICEEMWPSASRTIEALVKWPESQEPNHTGFAMAKATERSLFAELAMHPVRERRFANAMSLISQEEGYEPSNILKAYDLKSLEPWLFVDVGGSLGAVSVELARSIPHVRCIVQDLPEVTAKGEALLPPELSDEVTFMSHDFFSDQPVKGADIYFFRWIFHDWPDKYCVRILQALKPALKEGARIIISDFTMPPPGAVSVYNEWLIRAFDLAMLELFNSKERDAIEWAQLFEMADKRFQFVGITIPSGSKLSFIEARWQTSE